MVLNKFGTDTDEETDVVRRRCEELGAAFAVSDHHARGGDGAVELAKAVIETTSSASEPFKPLYEQSDPIREKIRKVARSAYGARDVVFTKVAERNIAEAEKIGYAELPVCIAKTQNSLSRTIRNF